MRELHAQRAKKCDTNHIPEATAYRPQARTHSCQSKLLKSVCIPSSWSHARPRRLPHNVTLLPRPQSLAIMDRLPPRLRRMLASSINRGLFSKVWALALSGFFAVPLSTRHCLSACRVPGFQSIVEFFPWSFFLFVVVGMFFITPAALLTALKAGVLRGPGHTVLCPLSLSGRRQPCVRRAGHEGVPEGRAGLEGQSSSGFPRARAGPLALSMACSEHGAGECARRGARALVPPRGAA